MALKDIYPVYADSDKGLTVLSTQNASELIKKYNIYFAIKLKSEYMQNHLQYFNYEKKYDVVYQLDNTDCFNKQLGQLHKLIDIGFEHFVFLTDYTESESLIIQRLQIAKETLVSKKEKPTLAKLRSESKIKDDSKISAFLQSFEIGTQGSLFA